MLTQAMKDTANKHRLGYVATVSASGQPNVSPKGTFVVIDDRTLAFGDIRSPGTITNLRERPETEVNFVDPFTRKGFRARGNATILNRTSDAYSAYRPHFDRWGSLADRIEHIVLIKVFDAKPLSSPVYDDGANETDLRAQWTETLLRD